MSGSGKFTLDTNILFYASDNTVPQKRDEAKLLVRKAAERNCILTLQSLSELFHSLCKRRLVTPQQAEEIVHSYRIFKIVPASESDLHEAIDARQQHNIPFWDAMLWATARRSGCTLLLSEDGHDGRTLGGVTIRNPFLMSANELARLLG